jgi:hypothetical protein
VGIRLLNGALVAGMALDVSEAADEKTGVSQKDREGADEGALVEDGGSDNGCR